MQGWAERPGTKCAPGTFDRIIFRPKNVLPAFTISTSAFSTQDKI